MPRLSPLLGAALADITIEQQLGMTSGIPDYMNVPNAAAAALTEAPDTVWASDQLIGFGADGEVQPAGTPGYSTTGYIALQEIAESLTGQTIGDLIRERITEPLGMTGTALPPNEDTMLPEPVSRGYLSTACIEELVADSAEAVPVGTDTTDWNASYGLGMMQFSNQLGHEGEAIGWEGWAGHDPDTGLTVVVFTNTCSDSAAVFQALGAVDPVFAPTAEALFGS